MDLRPSIAIRIANVAGRPPVMFMDTMTDDGIRSRWRMPVAMLDGGFLISPQIANVADLAVALRGQAGHRVTRLRLLGTGYGNEFTVRFSEIQLR